MAKKPKRKVINTISAIQFQREVPNADASLVAKDKVKDVKEIEKIVEVEKEVIREVEKIVEVPKEVIKEIIKEVEVPKEIIKEVEVIKEIEVPKEIIREVEVIKEVEKIVEVEVIREVEKIVEVEKEIIKEVEVFVEVEKNVPIEHSEVKVESLEEFVSDLKNGYDNNVIVEENETFKKVDDTFNVEETSFETTSDDNDTTDFYLTDEEEEFVDQSQSVEELTTQEIAEKIAEESADSKLQKLYLHHSKIRPFELYYRGVCVYSSLTYRVSIVFNKTNCVINGKKYNYAEGLNMKFLH